MRQGRAGGEQSTRTQASKGLEAHVLACWLRTAAHGSVGHRGGPAGGRGWRVRGRFAGRDRTRAEKRQRTMRAKPPAGLLGQDELAQSRQPKPVQLGLMLDQDLLVGTKQLGAAQSGYAGRCVNRSWRRGWTGRIGTRHWDLHGPGAPSRCDARASRQRRVGLHRRAGRGPVLLEDACRALPAAAAAGGDAGLELELVEAQAAGASLRRDVAVTDAVADADDHEAMIMRQIRISNT